MGFEFRCASCGEMHQGMPAFHAPAPLSYLLLEDGEKARRAVLGTDECILDDAHFFVRGLLEIPVVGQGEKFVWGVWVSLSAASFQQWGEYYDVQKRSHIGPFFGWLNTRLPCYPDTASLKTQVHVRDDGMRPFIELEPTDHPLAVEQRNGMSEQRAADIYAQVVHGRQT